jgi:hypothetical protein
MSRKPQRRIIKYGKRRTELTLEAADFIYHYFHAWASALGLADRQARVLKRLDIEQIFLRGLIYA